MQLGPRPTAGRAATMQCGQAATGAALTTVGSHEFSYPAAPFRLPPCWALMILVRAHSGGPCAMGRSRHRISHALGCTLCRMHDTPAQLRRSNAEVPPPAPVTVLCTSARRDRSHVWRTTAQGAGGVFPGTAQLGWALIRDTLPPPPWRPHDRQGAHPSFRPRTLAPFFIVGTLWRAGHRLLRPCSADAFGS